MTRKPRIAIVGAGSLGSALAVSLRRAGFVVDAVLARPTENSIKRARRLARQIGARSLTDAADLKAEVVWLCVPDSQIGRAALTLAEKFRWKGIVALHSSGALTSDELEPLRRRGAVVASVHPLMTFVPGSRPKLAGVPFAIEGDHKAVQIARQIVRELGGQPFAIRKEDKAAYHAWGTFASPLLTALLATTERVACLAGVKRKDAVPRMIPILQQTLANYAERGAARSFSGPIIRGDVETVNRHLNVLTRIPVARDVYVALAQASLEFLPVKHKSVLRRLLMSGTE
ncbi:MAG TPA: DUF2520 domain-containing protein [Candidatus Binatia bacterium]|nr:DUF2520 domain-containing protein [Candidatus Binatia bacterium]